MVWIFSSQKIMTAMFLSLQTVCVKSMSVSHQSHTHRPAFYAQLLFITVEVLALCLCVESFDATRLYLEAQRKNVSLVAS